MVTKIVEYVAGRTNKTLCGLFVAGKSATRWSYDEVRGRPMYLVQDAYNFEKGMSGPVDTRYSETVSRIRDRN